MNRGLKPETLLKRFKTYCVVCTRRIPRARHRRHAITCKSACQKYLTKLRKIERDHRQCSVCGRPSSPGERGEFRAWRHSKVQGQRKKRSNASKGILASAEATKELSKIAYVVTTGKKSARGNNARKGVAA